MMFFILFETGALGALSETKRAAEWPDPALPLTRLRCQRPRRHPEPGPGPSGPEPNGVQG